ncbi:SDR family NAD(P)-dependent oxidoreductase [Nocardioides insulae]|uniref:SDR family NAD(P)-dependent oxidoreductase n=1 Tax=Nocardioides insulae TaxID=394734 RepID=UPI0004051C76|nr:SDR family oxidoreductase [Nocardioides insulae]
MNVEAKLTGPHASDTLFDLSGRAAVITGGGTGIGFAMARALAGAGAEVTLWGRRLEKLDAAVAEIQAEGGKARAQQVDVSDEDAVVAGMAEAAAAMGGLDICVVNAGVGIGKELLIEATTDTYRKTLATNLDGAFWTMREAAKQMAAQAKDGRKGGSIINIASLAGIEGAGRNHAYGATKGALNSLTRSAAVELARYGVRVNAVLPGWIATDMTAGGQENEAFNAAIMPRVPARRWGEPDDFKGIAVYLGSDASRYQTGTTIVIDGGYSVF